MAKRAKKKKVKKKAAKKKQRSQAKRTKALPVSFATIVKIVRAVIDEGHEKDFLAATKGKFMTVDVATVGRVKKFFTPHRRAANPAFSRLAMSVAATRQERCEDFECPHIHQ